MTFKIYFFNLDDANYNAEGFISMLRKTRYFKLAV